MSFASCGLVSLCLWVSGGFGSPDEMKIPLNEVPKAVLEAVKAKFPGGELKEASKETDKDGVTFEITLTRGGKTVTVSLDEKGVIEEVETEIAVGELPAFVRDAVARKYVGSQIRMAEETVEFEHGKADDTAYELTLQLANGKTTEVTVEVSVEIEESAGDEKVPLSELPKVVLEAVKTRYPNAELKEASKETDEEEATYELTLNNAGRAMTVSLDAEGEIEEVETEITDSELPAAVREGVAKKYPGSTIKKSEEVVSFEDGKPTETEYELSIATADGKTIEVTVEANGEIEDESDED
jgi:uncharacterized membrane protein YkoI